MGNAKRKERASRDDRRGKDLSALRLLGVERPRQAARSRSDLKPNAGPESHHTSQSDTACRSPSSGSRVGMNSWPT